MGKRYSSSLLEVEVYHLRAPLGRIATSSVEEFFRLASCEIRRARTDLPRHYCGPHGAGAHERQAPAGSQRPELAGSDSGSEPGRLMDWQRFHEFVETM